MSFFEIALKAKMRLCTCCKWSACNYGYMCCGHLNALSKVTGEAEMHCEKLRENLLPGACGPEGKWFEWADDYAEAGKKYDEEGNGEQG